MSTYRASPWIGANNVEDENSDVFAPREGALPFLREAVNVDVTRMGQIRKRKGATKIFELTNGHSGFAYGSYVYLVDSGVLKQIDVSGTPAAISLAAGLNDTEMSYAGFGGQVFFCNGSARGRITENGVEPWGLASPPTPTLSVTTGNLFEGLYQVALTVDQGEPRIESGAFRAATITVAEGQGITVSNIVADLNATGVNVYLSEPNGSTLYWTARFELPVSTINIRNSASTRDPIRTFGCFEPPQGSFLAVPFKGWLLVAAGNGLYWSDPVAPHLFRWATNLQLFSAPVKFIAVVADGIYVAEGDRTWWLGGTDPSQFTRVLLNVSAPVKCAPLEISGTKVPLLETTARCVLWLTSEGIIAGLPGGATRSLTENQVAMPTAVEGDLLFREMQGISQVVASLRQEVAPNSFGFSDRAIGEVIYANQRLP